MAREGVMRRTRAFESIASVLHDVQFAVRQGHRALLFTLVVQQPSQYSSRETST
jgi:hypothetical protein